MGKVSALPDIPVPIALDDPAALANNDLKRYPHFDKRISLAEARLLVSDPHRVAHNKFYPFFLYHEEWQPFRGLEGSLKPERKSRPIRYAGRRDAYIFTYYRRKLSALYEKRVQELEISDCPIAYRKIPKSNSGGGKCNIDFAKDAFDEIKRQGNCISVALDIKGYFENLDRARIKSIWCNLIGKEKLPNDHYAVFKNITQYHVVEQKDVYRRLGYLKTVKVDGYEREAYTVPFREMPTQLCSPTTFREKICGGDPALPSLIRGNVDEKGQQLDRGIPQGAPISDLIANFYLLDFDLTMSSFAKAHNGKYMRYSDDIVLILPGTAALGAFAEKFVVDEIKKYGEHLAIKESKTCIVSFTKQEGGLDFQHLKGPQGKNGFEYLGFRFDGRKVYVRDSTISRLYRKVTISAKATGRALAYDLKESTAAEILNSFNYSNFSQRFSKVHRKAISADDYRTWTFYSYLKRASETFGAEGRPLLRQARNFKRLMRSRIREAVEVAVEKRDS